MRWLGETPSQRCFMFLFPMKDFCQMLVRSSDISLDAVKRSVWRLFPALLAVSCVVNLLLLVSAIYMLQVYDRVLSSGSMNTLLWLTLAALFALLLYGALEQVRRLILGRAGLWVENELSEPVLRRAMLKLLEGRNPDAGLRDVSSLRSFIGGDAVLAFLDAAWTPVFVAFIWLLHPGLGVLALTSVVALFLFALANEILTRGPLRKVGAEIRKSQIAAQRFVESGETIYPLGMMNAVLGNWRDQQRDVCDKQQRIKERTSSFVSASRALRLALQVMILGLGAYYVLQGVLTAGGMIAASIILGRALAPIERSIGAWQSFVVARDASGRLSEMFKGADLSVDAMKLPHPIGNLVVEELYCHVPGTTEPIIENINFSLRPGETLAIIGPSGSGKSTLCRLLVGAWKPSRGHVRLDNADVSTWDPEELGPHLGYLPQDVELFPGTVAQNIARMRDAKDGEVLQAAKAAGVHDLILKLPQGYETDVGVHGGRISGGQRQRLGLARALIGDPTFLVLDEPSSNLDQAGDAALAMTMDQLKKDGRTVVIVSHRPAALRTADKVLILKDGAVAAFGPREEILKLRAPPVDAKKSEPAHNVRTVFKATAE
jgi:ATP-binding cassette subfamily C exporter for protease/lipase